MEKLETLVREVQTSAKYRAVCPELIARIGQRELAARRSLKEAVKETKNALHQIAGAYLGQPPRYNAWLASLTAAKEAHDSAEFSLICRRMMQTHSSTEERMDGVETFYATVFDGLPPVHSVLDLACGLNPLARYAMPLAPGATYQAYDLYADMRDFLNAFFTLNGTAGEAHVADVAVKTDFPPADVALILKFLPVLEQQIKTAGLPLLQALPVKTLIVSFPTRTLGGRGKGMAETYESRFRALLADQSWPIERFVFPNEIAFRVAKP